MVVPIFACPILPNAVGERLEPMDVWCVVVPFVWDANQRSTAPSVKVVVPEVLERGLFVDHGFMGNCWDPNVGQEVRVVVLVEALERPWAVGDDVQVGDGAGVRGFGFTCGIQPRSWVDHVILAIGGLQASPAKDVGVGFRSM